MSLTNEQMIAMYTNMTKIRMFEERVAEIFDGVAEVIEMARPDVMAIEQLYSHYERPKTAILMGLNPPRSPFC